MIITVSGTMNSSNSDVTITHSYFICSECLKEWHVTATGVACVVNACPFCFKMTSRYRVSRLFSNCAEILLIDIKTKKSLFFPFSMNRSLQNPFNTHFFKICCPFTHTRRRGRLRSKWPSSESCLFYEQFFCISY